MRLKREVMTEDGGVVGAYSYNRAVDLSRDLQRPMPGLSQNLPHYVKLWYIVVKKQF
jgi:hypothetical protein